MDVPVGNPSDRLVVALLVMMPVSILSRIPVAEAPVSGVGEYLESTTVTASVVLDKLITLVVPKYHLYV